MLSINIPQEYAWIKSFKSANAFLNLRRIIYNFVRGDEINYES